MRFLPWLIIANIFPCTVQPHSNHPTIKSTKKKKHTSVIYIAHLIEDEIPKKLLQILDQLTTEYQCWSRGTIALRLALSPTSESLPMTTLATNGCGFGYRLTRNPRLNFPLLSLPTLSLSLLQLPIPAPKMRTLKYSCTISLSLSQCVYIIYPCIIHLTRSDVGFFILSVLYSL